MVIGLFLLTVVVALVDQAAAILFHENPGYRVPPPVLSTSLVDYGGT